MPDRLRMAVIGCGRVGTVHARAIRTSPHAVLVGVCDADPQRADRAANMFAASRFLDYRTLLLEMQLDAVTIATPNHLHFEPAMAAIEAGLHVFCEKPLATLRSQGQQMLAAAERQGVSLAVDYNRRFGFGYAKAQELFAQGRVGQLRHGVLHVTDSLPPPAVARWPEVILTTLLSHHVDLLEWFFGEIRTVSACWGAPPPAGLVRDVALTFCFAQGAIAALVGGYRDVQRRTCERMQLVGTAGQLVVEDVTQCVSLFQEDPDHVEYFRPNSFLQTNAFYETIAAHIHDFVERLSAERPLAVTGAHGLRGLQIAEAAILSQRQQRPVNVGSQSENNENLRGSE